MGIKRSQVPAAGHPIGLTHWNYRETARTESDRSPQSTRHLSWRIHPLSRLTKQRVRGVAADALEPREVGVVTDNCSAVLERQSRQMGIIDQVSARADASQQPAEHIAVPWCRADDYRSAGPAPIDNLPHGILRPQRRGKQADFGGQSHKGQHRHPREADDVRAGQRIVEQALLAAWCSLAELTA